MVRSHHSHPLAIHGPRESIGPASFLHQSTAWQARVAAVCWLQRWRTEMRRTMFQTDREEIEDAADAPWGQLMNESSGVPIIAVVDDDASVRESLAALAESVGYEAALFASAEEFLQSVRDRDYLAC